MNNNEKVDLRWGTDHIYIYIYYVSRSKYYNYNLATRFEQDRSHTNFKVINMAKSRFPNKVDCKNEKQKI